MRRAIINSIILIPLLIAAIRSANRPYFSTNTPYQTIQEVGLSLNTAIILAIILCTASLVLITAAYKHRKLPLESYLLLLMSPSVLAAAILDIQVIAIAALVAAAYLLRKRWLAIPLIAIATYIHPSAALCGLALAGYQAYNKRILLPISTLLLSAAAAILSPSAIETTIQFAELQAPGAVSIIVLILAVFASVQLWNENTVIPLLLSFLVIIPGAMFAELSLVVSAASAALGGLGLRIMRKRTWSLHQVKTVTTYFVLLGLLFAAVASTSQAIQAPPSQEIIEASVFINDLTDEPIATLSTQQAALRTYGVDTVDAQGFIDATSTDELRKKTTRFLLIDKEYPAAHLRFLLENTNSYVRILEGEYELYAKTNS